MQIREAAKVRNRQTTWYVMSDTTPGTEYIVHYKRNVVSHHKVWTCNCPDFTERRQFNGTNCKHIMEVKHQLFMKQAATPAVLSELTIKQVLDLVVNTLNGPNGRKLWHVLTALRGPDSSRVGAGLKDSTTAELRGALGINGKFTGAITATCGAFGKDTLDSLTCKISLNQVYSSLKKQHTEIDHHFVTHYVDALQALKELGYIK
jgi:hypothetical protein